jgi:hypothetical protein
MTSESEEKVIRFLQANTGSGVCHTCLASLFDVDFDQARKMIGQLRFRPGLKTESGHCSVCRKLKMTIRTTPAPRR